MHTGKAFLLLLICYLQIFLEWKCNLIKQRQSQPSFPLRGHKTLLCVSKSAKDSFVLHSVKWLCFSYTYLKIKSSGNFAEWLGQDLFWASRKQTLCRFTMEWLFLATLSRRYRSQSNVVNNIPIWRSGCNCYFYGCSNFFWIQFY